LYQKFITKKGKKIGPYFYESIRLKDGKVKAVYLGSNEQVALQKLQTLRKPHGLPEQPAQHQRTSSQTLSPIQQLRQHIQTHEQQKRELGAQYSFLREQYKKKIISSELFDQRYRALFGERGHKLAFIYYDSEVSRLEQELLRTIAAQREQQQSQPIQVKETSKISFSPLLITSVLLLLFFAFFQPSLTGLSFLFSEQPSTVEHLNILTNSSTTFILNLPPGTQLQSLKVSGSYQEQEGSSVRIYLVNDNYLIYDSQQEQPSLMERLSATLSSFFSGITGMTIVEPTQVSFFIMNSSWDELPTSALQEENNLTLFINQSPVSSLFFRDVAGSSLMLTDQAAILTPPNSLFFIKFYAFNLTELNFTEGSFTSTAEGIQLYRCPFWDLDLGLCLASWEEVLNLTPETPYTFPLSSGILAFAEASLTPREREEPSTNETLPLFAENATVETSVTNQTFFSNVCVDTCSIDNFTAPDYKLVIIVTNTTLNLSSIEYTVESPKGIQQAPERRMQSPTLDELLRQKQRKITFSAENQTLPVHKLQQVPWTLPAGAEAEDNWEKRCEGRSCVQTIYQQDRYFVKDDDSVELLENALETNCDGISDVCARGKKYRADFKQTPLEDESIIFTRKNQKISFQPLQLRYVNGAQEILLSSANPVYGYGENNVYSYPNIFGLGTEMRLTVESNQLKEEIIFSDNFLLTSNNIQDINGYIYIDYLVNLSDNLSFISANGPIIPSLNEVYFFNSSPLDSLTENIAVLPQPFVVSNTGVQLLDYVLIQTIDGFILSLRIPLSFMTQSEYPLIVDPTITLNHTQILFDGYTLTDFAACYERDGTSATMSIGNTIVGICGGAEAANLYRADIDWDITSVPRNADIVDINLTLNVEIVGTETNFEFYHMDANSSQYPDNTAGNEQFHTDIRNGTMYLTDTIVGGQKNFNLTSSAQLAPDFETILWALRGWWSIGITTGEAGGDAPSVVTTKEGTLSVAPTLMIQYDLPVPSIFLNELANNSIVNRLEDIHLNATVYDNEPQIQEVVFFASNKTVPDGDDIIHIALNIPNASGVEVNWTAPVWEKDQYTNLLIHLNNRSIYGENDTYIVDYSDNSFNGTIVPTSSGSRLTFYNFTGAQIGAGMGFQDRGQGVAAEPAPNFYGENISFGDKDELIGPDTTWLFWVRMSNTSTSGDLLSKISGTSGLKVTQEKTNLVVTANSNVINLSNFFFEHDMTQLAITLDNSNIMSIYKNGTLINFSEGISVTDNAVPFELLILGPDVVFAGVLDEFVVLNRTLNVDEVLRSYQVSPDTYYWFVNATDDSGEPLGVNMSDIFKFTFNAVPYVILEAPANASIVRRANLTLNTSVYDDTLDTMTVKIFADNTTVPSGAHLVYYEENVSNGTLIVANFTAPSLISDADTQILYHLDNNSLYGESDSIVYNFADGGVLNGTPQANAAPNYTNEILAGVYSFDGTGDYIDTPCNFPCYQLRNATYMGWAKSWTVSGGGVIMGAYFDALFWGFFISRNGDDLDVFSDGPTSVSSPGHFAPGEWLHFAVRTYGNTTVDIFVNGTFRTTGEFSTVTDITGAGRSFTIGVQDEGVGSSVFNGDLDELMVINRTLTDSEILDAYRLKSQKYFWFVNASDGKGENQSDTYEFRINSLPEFSTGPSLTPLNANTTNTYTCSFTITDEDPDDSLTYSGDFLNFSTSLETFSSGTTNGTLVAQTASGDIQGKNDQNRCDVTASDNYESSSTASSNTITVLNSPPNNVSLINPEHLNETFNRTPSFDYDTTTDPDGDMLNYTLNLTCLSTAGGSCTGVGDDRLLTYTTNVSALQQELAYFIDDNFFYNWTVLATDGENDSDWAEPARSINISILVDISLTINAILFGTRSVGQSVEANAPDLISPFILRNNGNVEIEVNLSENSTVSLFISTPAPTSNYLFRADNSTDEPGAFSGDSVTTMTQISRTPTNTTVLKKFNHTDTIDEAEIEINITVPSDEPQGYKESTIEFIGYYASPYL